MKKLILSFQFKHIFFCLIALGFMLQACNKKPNQIGSDFNQDLITLVYTDTVDIVAYSLQEDSVRTDEPDRITLGSMKDPVFGTTVAGFYTRFLLSTASHTFGENPQLDSLVLQMTYSGYYGDTTTAQTLHVYELQEPIYIDSAYYSKTIKTRGTTDFANYTFSPKPSSGFPYDGDTLAPMIRVRLSDISPDLGNKILSATAEQLVDNTVFGEFFNGLHVTAEAVSSGGAILYWNLPVTTSRMTIYYSNDEQDSLRYEFFISSGGARFNTFEHFNYQDADPLFKSQVIDGDTTLGRDMLYLQGTNGIKTKLRFPNLKHMKGAFEGANIVVNEAKIIFPGRSLDTTMYFAPAQLAIVEANGDGTYNILDDQLEGDSYYGGSYLASNKYQFRLNHYIQDLILNGADKADHGLFLFVVGASSKANRWVFNGTTPTVDTLSPLRLMLNYSVVVDVAED